MKNQDHGGAYPLPIFRRVVFAFLMAAGFIAGNTSQAQEVPRRATRPNVLLLFADDQRADTIAALGNARIRTPNLDRLASQGTAFTRTYCMGSMQGAVCVPSRAMLLTGRTLFHIKDDLEGQPTWPEAFARQGYATFLTGKWHNKGESALRVFQQGKAVFLGGMGDPYKLKIQDISSEHTFINERTSGEHSVKLFADAAAAFIRGRTGETPFLCYVPFNLPHDPRVAPPEYHRRYDVDRPPLPANFLPQHPFNNGELVIRDEELAPWPRTPEVVRRHLADYYAAIEFLDAQIGRILEALKASGRYENTLIVFAADHGLAIGSHGLFGKQNLYEHSMRAPLIIAGPGVPRGRRANALCYLLDIFPTLGDLAGIPAPEGSEGLSLAPVLAGERRTRRDSIFTAYRDVQRAVRDDDWKLIVYPQVNKTQLFNLRDDPDELHDLADDPGRAGEILRLTGLLRRWQKQSDDEQPLSTSKPLPLEFPFPEADAKKASATR
ncbi:MAG: sulfatase-like hydrolase/transferase [Isosphaeraceae bacterium]